MNITSGVLPLTGTISGFGAEPSKLYEKTNGAAFDSFYDAAIKLYEDTNKLQLEEIQTQLDYITGKTDNMLSVVMAQEKAYSSLTFTTQVTNKVIEAYREIMRMQI